jgi:magnesium-dependent phosphatase 1
MASPSYPSIAVFDLDFTCWPFWVDTHVDPPFSRHPRHAGDAIDRAGRHVRLWPDICRVFADLEAHGVRIALASRTGAVDEAEALLALLHGPPHPATGAQRVLNDLVWHKEIYPGDKKAHFRGIRARAEREAGDGGPAAAAYEDMLFFDDESRNIVSVGAIGVTCVFVDDAVGVTWGLYQDGLRRWREANKGRLPAGAEAGAGAQRGRPSAARVFVYGSLRRGEVNHRVLGAPPDGVGAAFVCSALTEERFSMVGLSSGAFPYITKERVEAPAQRPRALGSEAGKGASSSPSTPSSSPPSSSTATFETWCVGEVYEVDDAGIRRLDAFEGHPGSYTRTTIRVVPVDEVEEGGDKAAAYDGAGAHSRPRPLLPFEAFAYVAQDAEVVQGLRTGLLNGRMVPVASGDWSAFLREKGTNGGGAEKKPT